MERVLVGFGFALVCFFFLCMLVIGSQFVWGVVTGLIITGFGWMFWDE